jgi:poly(A) polymerase
MSLPEPHYRAALTIARSLRAAGHQAYFAGGCVRDLLLGLTPQDYDVATSATPSEIIPLFKKTHSVGAHFGVVLVCTNDHHKEIQTEVATFRHDGAYSDGRHPDAVRFSTTPEEDVLRRDFTINGMMLDPLVLETAFEATGDPTSALLDLVGGQADLAAGIVRAIGSPERRFAEDKLRMLRAVRFAARLNFQLDPATAAAIRHHAPEIHHVSAERVRDELTRILTEGNASRGFELLFETGLLQQVLPEVVRLRNVPQPPEYHPEGDVWTHTLLLLEKLPLAPQLATDNWQLTTVSWAALLHDIGKPATYQPAKPAIPSACGETKPDRIRFNGHVEVGVRIAETILTRFRFSNDDTFQILSLVQNHMRFGDILHMKQSTLKRFLRLPHFEEHLALHWLDASSAHGDLTLYHYARAAFLVEPAPEHRPAPLLTGEDLIAAGYRPSPQFKPMLTLAEDAQLEGSIHSTAEALALVQSKFPLPLPAGVKFS